MEFCKLKSNFYLHDIEVKDEPVNWNNIYYVVVPFLITIMVSCFTDYYFLAFTSFTSYLIAYSKLWKNLISYINWELLWIVAVIIILGNLIGSYYPQMEEFLKQYKTPESILIVAVLGFLASFMLGSSAKYASIVSLLTSVFGIQYFVLFFTLEFLGVAFNQQMRC